MRSGCYIAETLSAIQLITTWRFVHFVIHTYPEEANRFAHERSTILQEVVHNCDNLIRNVRAFESACTEVEIRTNEASLCRGVRGVRHDAHVCLERISAEREILSNISLLSVLRGLRADIHRIKFYRDLLRFVTQPNQCPNNGSVLCVDWSAVFGADLMTCLIFGILPFSTTAGAWTSLLSSLLILAVVRGFTRYVSVELHGIIRRHRRSRIFHLLFPMEILSRSSHLWLSILCGVLLCASTTSHTHPHLSLLIRCVFSFIDTPLWQTIYRCVIGYLTLIVFARFTQISKEISTQLALEELREIESDIVRLWLESDPTDLDRLSDAALLEILLRVKPTQIELVREPFEFILKKRPCLKLLLDERFNINSLCDGELKRISERLCILFHRRNDFHWRMGAGVGFMLLFVYTIMY